MRRRKMPTGPLCEALDGTSGDWVHCHRFALPGKYALCRRHGQMLTRMIETGELR